MQEQIPFNFRIVLAILGTVFFVLMAILLLRPQILVIKSNRAKKILSRHDKIGQIISSLQSLRFEKTGRLLGYTICHVITYISQFYLLLQAFADLSYWNAFHAISSAMLVKTLLPISIGDLGIRESAAIYFLGQFHVKSVASFNASLLLFLINIFLPSMVGLVLILRNHINGNSKFNSKIIK